MSFIFIIVDLIIITSIVFWIRHLKNSKGGIEKDTEKFLSYAKDYNINVSKYLYLPYDAYPKMLIIDDIKKRVHYLRKPNKKNDEVIISSYLYSDILKCELINNTHYETVDSLATIRHRRISNEYVRKQGFAITVNDIANPIIEMNYVLDRKGIKCSFLKPIQEWISTFEIIIHQNSKKENN